MGACGGKPKEDDLKEVIPVPILQPGMRRPSFGRAVSDKRYQGPSGAGARAGSGPIVGEDVKAQQLVDQRQAFSCYAATGENMYHQGGHSHTRLSEQEAKKWLLVKEKKDFTRFRMVCFPYAGGNSNFYKAWDFKDTEMVLVELPGRNARYGERVMTDIYAVARKIAQAMDTLGLLESTIPTIFFGHSYGAMCATLTAQVLLAQYEYKLHHLVVSGCVPLHLRAGRPKFSVDNDDELIASLLDMGGITKDMAKNREVVDQFLLALKGDYLAVDKYSYREESPLGCPVLALGSDNDPRVPAHETQEWGRYTSGLFQHRVFAGGHFFLKASHAEVTAYIASIVLAGPARTASAGLLMYDPNAN